MKNVQSIVTEEKVFSKKQYIPIVAFLLGAPLSILSSFFVQGKSENFAALNQVINTITPQVFADDVINFQGNGQWTNQNGGMTLDDYIPPPPPPAPSCDDGGSDDGDSDDSC